MEYKIYCLLPISKHYNIISCFTKKFIFTTDSDKRSRYLMQLSVYFTPVNCRLVGNVHWVQIFKSKSNFPRVRIILNAEIEFFNNDCYAVIHYILLLWHRIELCRPGVNTIIIIMCDFKRIETQIVRNTIDDVQ